MSFIDIAASASSYKEEHTVEEGEYKVRIVNTQMFEEKGFVIVRLELVDDPFAKEITHLMNLPGFGRNAKEENKNIGRIMAFYECFGMDVSKAYDPELPEPEGYINREGWVILGPPVDDNKGYGEQNKIKYDGFVRRR